MLEHSPQLNITQSELAPRVADYFDTLLAQRDAILEKYDLTPETAEEFCNLRSTDEDRESMFALYEKMVYVLQNKDIPQDQEYRQAQEIMGENFFGKEAVERTFGFELDEHSIPRIPYSREELIKAKELGEILILRVSTDQNGEELTIERVRQIFDEQWPDHEPFSNLDLYRDGHDPIYNDSFIHGEWKLVRSPVPDIGVDEKDHSQVLHTFNLNYLHQTRCLRNYLKSVGSLSEEDEEQCSDEILSAMSEQMGISWANPDIIIDYGKRIKKWADISYQVSKLPINIKNRRRCVEIFYDSMVQKYGSERIPFAMPSFYEWTNEHTPAMELYYVRMKEESIGFAPPYVIDLNIGLVSQR